MSSGSSTQVSGSPGDQSKLRLFFRQLLKPFGFAKDVETSLRESIEEAIVEHDDQEGAEPLGDEERSMLINILNYGDLRLDDIMVPRADIVAIDGAAPFSDLIKALVKAAHSRLPVYRGALDDIIGMVHVKDALRVWAECENSEDDPKIIDIQRPVLFVAPSMRLMDLLARMRASRTHMAIVVDEYGGTDGLVTIEDLVEQIVGDIEDEHDEESPVELIAVGDNIFDADARVPIDDLETVLGCDLLPDERDEDVDTVGGLVASLSGQVLEIGDIIDHPDGFRFEVLDADPRRLKRVRVHGPKPE